jgi:signal transduction histidine kinase/ligand-binding sensor domain-containing protein/DNA-binding response OmpR family regulator
MLKSLKFLIATTVVSLTAAGLLKGQSMFFSNLSTRDGLPSNIISAIAQDENHFIWVGTGNGLARYDGYEFKTFKRQETESSLPANEISSLLVDGDYLWIGTWQGLSKINTTTFEISRVKLDNNNVIRALYKDKKGNIWIGTANGLVKYFNGKATLYTKESSHLSHNTIRSIYEDIDGNLWVGTYHQLNKLDPKTDRFTGFDLKGSYKPELKNNLICDIKPVAGKDSLLWIGTETGLILFDRFTNHYDHFTARTSGFSNEIIKNIYTSPDGLLWLGTDFGLNVYDSKSKISKPFFHNPEMSYSIPNNVIWEIFEDAGGVVWFVTSNGLGKINKHNHLFNYHEVTHQIDNQTVGNQVKSVLVTKRGVIWIASIHGVIRINPEDNSRKTFGTESIPEERILLNNVFALEEDDFGRIWIGTAGGINIWDEQHHTMHAITASENNGLTSNYIARFIKGADGSFWVSAWEGGLFKIVAGFEKLSTIKFEFVGDFASEKICYAVNSLWGIQHNELYRIDLNSYVAKKVEGFEKMARDRDIYNLYYAPQGSLWAGTLNGLIEYRPTLDSAYFHPIITGNEIDFNNIISDTYGNIWAAADKFIIKYQPQSRMTQIFPLDKDLPLKTFYNNCSSRLNRESLLFGGDNGFISFRTDIKPNHYQPRVFITSLEINNRPVQPGREANEANVIDRDIAFMRELTLDYSERSIALSFASLHYWQPEINVFAYKMEGLERDWKYVSGKKNYAVYSNLLPGTYKLRIRATNNYGIWSDEEATLKIIVKPPLFLSPLFIGAYIILIIVAIVIGFRIYAVRLKLKNEIKIARIEKEYAEEIIQAKQQFFTSISHELRTPISLIIPPIQQIIKRGNLDEESKSLITLAEKNSQRLLRLINQILDFRKLEHENQSLKLSWFDLVPFSQELYTLFTDKAARNEINFIFDAKVKSSPIWADKEKIEIIIFNLLSNAFKFTPKKGAIVFTIEIEDSTTSNGSIKLSVSDSGIGIALEEQSRIFEQFYQTPESRKIDDGSGIGLTLVSEYTKLHKGKIKLISEKGTGSTFSIILPLGNDHFPVDKSDEGSEVDVVATRATQKENNAYELYLRSNKPLILIVEDNVDMIDFMVVSLKEKFNFIIAENGEDGLNKAHKLMPALIVSDIMMPVMDGLEFCRKIKQDSKTSHIPIILLTAKSLTSQKIEGIRMGADIYMTKPFEIELLEAHIDHLLERQSELAQYFKHELITQPVSATMGENEDDRFLKKVMNTIEVNIANPEFSVELLSEEMGMSATHLYRKLKSLTHLSANEIIKKYRIKKASLLLKNKEGNISEIMYEVGFSNLSYFSKCFKTEFGITPKEYQQKESRHSYSLQENLGEDKQTPPGP